MRNNTAKDAEVSSLPGRLDDDDELIVRASAVLKEPGARKLVPWETRYLGDLEATWEERTRATCTPKTEPSALHPLARGPRVPIGWPLPLGFGLGGSLLLARRGRVCV